MSSYHSMNMNINADLGAYVRLMNLSGNMIPHDHAPTPNGLLDALLDHERFAFNFSVGLVAGWMILVVMSTFTPTMNLDIISLKSSWNELTSSRDSQLDILDVFRVIAIVWVIVNHLGSEGRVDILEGLPSAKAFKDAVHNHPIFGALLGNSALGVEIFLVLSGLLAARSWHRQSNQPFFEHARIFLVKRVFRLLPIMAVFIFVATGPIVKYALPRFHNTMVANCGTRGIISHLTLTANWQSTPTCLGYLWYLGLDTQLYLIAPILLHFLYHRTRFAVCLILFLTSVSAFLRAVYCQTYGVCNKSDVDIPFIFIPSMNPEQLRQTYAGLWEMYSRPCTKCGPFLIGLLLGFITSNVKIQLSVPVVRRVFTLGLTCAIVVIYAILPEYWWPNQGNTVYNTLYTAMFRTIFATAVAIMIGALFYSVSRPRISYFWAILAKLTFNVYLLHMPTVYVFNHLPYLQTTVSAYSLIVLLPFVCALSFLAALVFYLFVEAPLSRISNQFLKTIS
ncbi:Acyl-transf-3 domain-containing protein [Aphelenchoides besseyi]|nr:Acyl-transf-3 domain-containing protein [Aphelenchoides besseyi]